MNHKTFPQNRTKYKSAFTLIELSIVLVIIGLIIGGVLVGRDLIRTAESRSQIAQIEQFQTAVNIFQTKYNNLPGDMPLSEAISYGFYRNTSPYDARYETGCLYAGEAAKCGDGNGIISSHATGYPTYQGGESHLFWLDLNLAKLITYSPKVWGHNIYGYTPISDYLPPAKLANQFVYAWNNGKNYLTISGVNAYCDNSFGFISPNCSTSNIMSVTDAKNMDQKIDDGLPQSGNVIAMYIGASETTPGCYNPGWVGALWVGAATNFCSGDPTTAATAGSSTTCYDNNNTAGQKQQYSTSQNSGNNRTCALSFEF